MSPNSFETEINQVLSNLHHYLMTVSAASIAFAIIQTRDSSLNYGLFFWLLAVVFWALSFFLGYKRSYAHISSVAYKNLAAEFSKLLKHKEVQDIPNEDVPILIEAQSRIIEAKLKEMHKYQRWQMLFLIFGAISYLLYHLYQIFERSHICYR